MAIAKVTLVCPTCGAEFVKKKECRNRTEANGWEDYMKDADMECPECYKARKTAENETAAAEYGVTSRGFVESSDTLPADKAWATLTWKMNTTDLYVMDPLGNEPIAPLRGAHVDKWTKMQSNGET